MTSISMHVTDVIQPRQSASFKFCLSAKVSILGKRVAVIPPRSIHHTGNTMVSEMGAVSQQRAPDPELSPNIESTRTESDQEELEDHDATAYVSFHSSERIHARQASEAIAQIEHLTLNILEQIVASLEKPPVVGKHSKSDAKVEIQIADRRRDKTSG